MSAGNFNGPCLPFTIAEEGGLVFTNDPRDPGGPTFAGITLARWRAYTRHPAASATELRSLTWAQVLAFYGSQVWAPNSCEEMPAGLDLVMLDAATNTGHDAARQLQTIVGVAADGWAGPGTVAAVRAASGARVAAALGPFALGELQGTLGLAMDRVCGPVTREAAEARPVAAMVWAMHGAALDHYQHLPTFATFGSGWVRRLARRSAAALALAGAA